ncbi:MAG: SpaH/EbpB family LPXTG-anchored major pilin [Oscillospiraceae bacterium]|nr:SpaH/EbpB family LPXTG-anchored major pilin [Oscillospiraceae bacterium]
MKKILRCSLAVFLAATLFLTVGAVGVLANPTLDGRDPNRPVSLTLHHNIGPDGEIIAGDPTGAPPSPLGQAVAGSEWQAQLITVPAGETWDGSVEMILENPEWLGDPIVRKTDLDGRAYFGPDVMVQGFYLVTELTVDLPEFGAIATPFLVSLPYLWNDEWVYDVHVFPKDPTTPVLGKVLDDVAFDGVDLVITWTFSVDIRLGLATIAPIEEDGDTYIRVIDQLDNRLAFVPGSVSIYFDVDVDAGQQQALSTDGWRVTEENDNTIYIDFLQAGIIDIAAEGEVGGFIYMTFDTIASITGLGELGVIENDGTLIYSNHPQYELGERPQTTLFGLQLNKVNVDDSALPGAVFHLYEASDIYDGHVVYGALPIKIETTDENGRAFFYGLPAGIYYLYEYAAPDGYRRLTAPMQVEIRADVVSPYLVEVTVTNIREGRMPLTGGTGTLIFTAVGLVLVGGALLLVVLMGKKKKKEKN